MTISRTDKEMGAGVGAEAGHSTVMMKRRQIVAWYQQSLGQHLLASMETEKGRDLLQASTP